MANEVEITVGAEERFEDERHRELVARKAGVSVADIKHLSLIRVTLDARKGRPRFHLRYGVWIDEEFIPELRWSPSLKDVRNAEPVVIIGCGPAGMFAALRLIELGFKPVILERGKDVRERRRDIATLTKTGAVNPDSNYCFGEGGAGTFSDGKLYTRAHKRGSVKRVLEILHYFGAPDEILVDAHPHVGTNKLPQVVQAIRESIVAQGGEIHFNSRVSDIDWDTGGFRKVTLQNGVKFEARSAILATGHSARDIFELLVRKEASVELKPFALGVRTEHPQQLIDRVQYRQQTRHPNLPTASYALNCQVENHGVFSFCMCPGGIICPAATAEGEIVTNGWSPSKRNSLYANSGIVVEIKVEDLTPFAAHGPLAGLRFQQEVEQRAFVLGGGRQVAPAQRISDFISSRPSKSLPECSYFPGVTPVELDNVLPKFVASRLRQAMRSFDNSLKGFISDESIAVAVESRTSSPVRIPRDPETLSHQQIPGLYPCGEGAGYAGGILSAAMDGERVAEAVSQFHRV